MKKRPLRLAFLIALALLVTAGSGVLPAVAAAQAAAQESWKKEFDDICSRTEDAGSLQPVELKQLIARCDALKPAIDRLDETQKKVYSKKLQMCRDLFSFMLSAQ